MLQTRLREYSLPRALTRVAHGQGFMLSRHLSHTHTHTVAAAPSLLPFNKPAVKPHYQGSLSNNWLPSVHPFPFCMKGGGFALSRRATADNKSEWQAHSQRPPRTKAAAWWIIDIGNLTPTHPTPLRPSQMPMADQYQGPICNSLLADYLRGTVFTVWLPMSTPCMCSR